MFDVFTFPFFQRGVWEILLLAVGAGLIGTWIVLRGLAFYTHAVGTATFPGLVLADGLAFPATLGAAGTGALVAVAVGLLARRERTADRTDSVTAIVLCGALALGIILASDVFESAANVETLLFGSLLVIDDGDLVLAGIASAVVLAATRLLETRWLVTGFDPATAPALGARSAVPDIVLLALVALVGVSVLSAVGALLATALIVVPAAATRLVYDRLHVWQAATVALVAVLGVAGLWLSVQTDAPPGATIAVLSGGTFVLAALWRAGGGPLAGHGRAVAAAGATAVAALLAVGCGDDGGGNGDRVKVVATTTQLADVARAVGGPDADVVQLLHANSDPHDYEPRPSDLRRAAGAKALLQSGSGLDDWAGEIAAQNGLDDVRIDVGKGRPVVRAGDPHWWHDPRNVTYATDVIRDALIDADPDHRAAFAARAATYRRKLATLDRDIAACLRRIPARERLMVSDHDAFGYFTSRYGITFVGAVIPATTTQAQASAGELSALVATIRRRGVRAVFPESAVNPKLAEAIARRTGAVVGRRLYADTLGPEGSAGATYLGSERANADAIARGLSGGHVRCDGSTP